MKKRFLVLSLTILLSIGLMTGCADSKADPNGTQTQEQKDVTYGGGDSSTAENSYSAQERYDIKYNAYVRLNNELVKLKQKINLYFSYVDYAETFRMIDGKDYAALHDTISGIDQSILEQCLEVSGWQTEQDFAKMDGFVREYATRIMILSDTFRTIHDDGNYSDNEYAKAIQWHKTLWENAETVYVASEDFMDLVKEMSRKQAEQDEAVLYEQGRLIQYNCSRAITIAGEILELTEEMGILSDSRLVYDFTEIEALYGQLAMSVQNYDIAIGDPARLEMESLENSVLFDQLLTDLCASVKRLSESHKNGASREDVVKDLGVVRLTYDRCVERYNCIFSE